MAAEAAAAHAHVEAVAILEAAKAKASRISVLAAQAGAEAEAVARAVVTKARAAEAAAEQAAAAKAAAEAAVQAQTEAQTASAAAAHEAAVVAENYELAASLREEIAETLAAEFGDATDSVQRSSQRSQWSTIIVQMIGSSIVSGTCMIVAMVLGTKSGNSWPRGEIVQIQTVGSLHNRQSPAPAATAECAICLEEYGRAAEDRAHPRLWAKLL